MSLRQVVPEGARVHEEELQDDYDDDDEDEEEQDLCSDDDDYEDDGEEDDLSNAESFEICPFEASETLEDLSGLKDLWHSPLIREKPTSVDPVSLKQSSKVEGQPPSSPSSSANAMHVPIGSQLFSKKFVSTSLPCSTTSSPQSDRASTKDMMKKWNHPPGDSHPAFRSKARQQSAATPRSGRGQGMRLRRSKSCGEGRSRPPPEEFDILSSNFPRPTNGVLVLYECSDHVVSAETIDPVEQEPHGKDGFKCGAFCLFIPGLSKKKQAPANNREDQLEDQGSNVSRVFSLEKFECGSWSSSAIFDAGDDDSGANSYFDLPLELIRSSENEANSPVKTAFFFERSQKGVLKKSTSRLAPRKSHESSNRHVRFSTSAPVSYPPSPSSACITPRLLKAREEFNALLEAQSA